MSSTQIYERVCMCTPLHEKKNSWKIHQTSFMNFMGDNMDGQGGFPLSCKFYVHTDINFAGLMCVNKIKSDTCMNGLRKSKKLSIVQPFTFMHAAHTSLLTVFYLHKAS